MTETGRRPGLLTLVGVAVVAGGCVSAHNYGELAGPRFAAPAAEQTPAVLRGDTLVAATFNIENGEEVERALSVIMDHRNLRMADVLLLQEVDAEATRRIADALGMGWVYYPARERGGQGFGNAVLSRWPIVEDAKLILPHRSWFGGTQRTATMAVVQIRGTAVRVYSTHLATPVNQSPGDRRDQLRTILEDAADDSLVVIGGDLNSGSIPELALKYGYAWPTREGPHTVRFIRADHLLFKGFGRIKGRAMTGTIMENRDASDHRPVWARVLFLPHLRSHSMWAVPGEDTTGEDVSRGSVGGRGRGKQETPSIRRNRPLGCG